MLPIASSILAYTPPSTLIVAADVVSMEEPPVDRGAVPRRVLSDYFVLVNTDVVASIVEEFIGNRSFRDKKRGDKAPADDKDSRG